MALQPNELNSHPSHKLQWMNGEQRMANGEMLHIVLLLSYVKDAKVPAG